MKCIVAIVRCTSGEIQVLFVFQCFSRCPVFYPVFLKPVQSDQAGNQRDGNTHCTRDVIEWAGLFSNLADEKWNSDGEKNLDSPEHLEPLLVPRAFFIIPVDLIIQPFLEILFG